LAGHLSGAQKRIQLRQYGIFCNADKDYGTRVAKGLKLTVKEVEKLAAMSQKKGPGPLQNKLFLY